MNKCHININWVNDTTPAINDTNLNYMDGCIDTIDDRVISLDTTKANQSDLLTCVSSITYNTGTGIMTITLKDGTSSTIDTGLAKLSVNFDYDDDPTSPHYEQLIITMADGTYKYVDLSALITQFEFGTTDTIAFTVGLDGSVTADVRDGSITGTKLQPNYLADVTAQANAASAAASTSNANQLLSEGYANGTQGGVPVTSGLFYHNNAKYWKEQAQAIAGGSISGLSDVSISNPSDGQALTYDAANQEWVNSTPIQTLSGLTDTDINLPADGDVLTYDSTSGEWQNKTLPTPASALSDLTDTDITSPRSGDVLVYNSSSGEWENNSDIQDSINSLYNEVGTKNINNYPYYEMGKTASDITFTVNADGSVTASGIATAAATITLHSRSANTANPCVLPNGNYIFTGCPAGGAENKYRVRLSIRAKGSGSGTSIGQDIGAGVSFTIDGDYYSNDNAQIQIVIEIASGMNLTTPITFYPMIRNASISDDTWQPYGQASFVKKSDITSIIATGNTNTTGAQIANKTYFYLNGVFCKAISTIAVDAAFTKNTNYKETTIGEELKALYN